jgi:phage shock protein C
MVIPEGFFMQLLFAYCVDQSRTIFTGELIMSAQYKQLYRSRKNRMIGGVCGGLGEYFDIDPTLVRVLFVFGAFLGLPGALALIYLVMLVLVPQESIPVPAPEAA